MFDAVFETPFDGLFHSPSSVNDNIGDSGSYTRQLRTRLALISESNLASFVEWTNSLRQNLSVCRVSESYIADISPSRFEYDTLIVAGVEPTRLRRFLALYEPAIRWKSKIALLQRCGPRDRARLLRTGFDDIFDLRMLPEEACLRMQALHLRYKMTREHQQQKEGKDRLTAQTHELFFLERLSERESEIFRILLAARGNPVPHGRLARALAHREEQTLNALKVTISGLRKKLKPGVVIANDRQIGYALLNKHDISPPKNMQISAY